MKESQWFSYWRTTQDLASAWFSVGPVWHATNGGVPWKLRGVVVSVGPHNFVVHWPMR